MNADTAPFMGELEAYRARLNAALGLGTKPGAPDEDHSLTYSAALAIRARLGELPFAVIESRLTQHQVMDLCVVATYMASHEVDRISAEEIAALLEAGRDLREGGVL